MGTNQNLPSTFPRKRHHLTRQRQLVLDILNASTGHPDASLIFLQAKEKDDRISLATVYRSLDFLKQAGLVKENNFGEGHAHFETTQDPHHYHFNCQGCGNVIELSEGGLEDVLHAFAQRNGLKITDIQLNLQGYCTECQQNSRDAQP